MTPRVTSVSDALDLLVPSFEQAPGDWEQVMRLALRPVSTTPMPRDRRGRRRRLALGAVALVAVAALAATPAFGLRGLIADLLGRIDVPFTGNTAPVAVKREFYDLGLGAPPSMNPGVIASQTRQVATFRHRGKTRVLWVAPTRKGGYCWQFSGWLGGCRADRTIRRPPRVLPGQVGPGLLGVSFRSRVSQGVESVSLIGGDILSSAAKKLVVRYADGSATDVRFYFVSKPIDAGFFFQRIPAGHDTIGTRPTAVELLDADGDVIARQPFFYLTAAQRAKELARVRKEMMERAGKARAGRGFGPDPPPTTGSPTTPVQRGESDGVTVVAGGNGVVVFDLSRATPAARKLVGKRGVSYGCFRRLPYHREPVVFGNYYRATSGRAVIRMQGMPAPYDGCDIQGSYGHTWPDRNNSHSAIEVAFTPAGRRFLEDRAAARDLAGFARSPAMHRLRKLDGTTLEQALQSRYGSLLTKLASPTAPIRPRKVGYTITGTTVTFVERSTTGRRFHVRFVNGRLRGQNVRPLALAF